VSESMAEACADSPSNNGAVTVTRISDGGAAVRSLCDGLELIYDAGEWRAFVGGAHDGEFDFRGSSWPSLARPRDRLSAPAPHCRRGTGRCVRSEGPASAPSAGERPRRVVDIPDPSGQAEHGPVRLASQVTGCLEGLGTAGTSMLGALVHLTTPHRDLRRPLSGQSPSGVRDVHRVLVSER
jgi:hypothetical protein